MMDALTYWTQKSKELRARAERLERQRDEAVGALKDMAAGDPRRARRVLAACQDCRDDRAGCRERKNR